MSSAKAIALRKEQKRETSVLSGTFAHRKRGSVARLKMMELKPSPCRTQDVGRLETSSLPTTNWKLDVRIDIHVDIPGIIRIR
jgi:hypothetical protein